MLNFPKFPANAVVVISIPDTALVPEAESVNFSNLLNPQPYLVAFCGKNGSAWEDSFDWYIVSAALEHGDKLLSILTISDAVQVKSYDDAITYVEPYILNLDNPVVVYHQLV